MATTSGRDARAVSRRRAGMRLFALGAPSYRGPVALMWAHYSTLLLTTTGRRTGRPHSVALTYVETPEGFAVGAGAGPRSDWYLNLRARPDVEVRIGARRLRAEAETVADPARWHEAIALLVPAWRRFAPPRALRSLLKRFFGIDYDAEVDRAPQSMEALPVVILKPIRPK